MISNLIFNLSWLISSQKVQLSSRELSGTQQMEEVGGHQVTVIEKSLFLCCEKPFPDL